VESFPKIIALTTLKSEFMGEEFHLVRKGNRLSVMPVSDSIAKRIFALTTTL
jgi:predicted RNA-binding protein with PUA-like domain